MKLLHILSHIILIVLILAQITLTFVLYTKDSIEIIRVIGWITLFTSSVFGWSPIFELRRKGGVPKGQSFVKTTKLVNTGVYSIVRHPQFLGGILLGFSLMLIAQHWLIVVLGIPIMIIFYLAIVDGDKEGVKKFGDEYKQYTEKVPRINFLAGIVRLIKK